MFERVSIRIRDPQPPERLDVGLLAEALLFYDHVHVFAGRSTLDDLLEAFGPDTLLDYLKESIFTLTYTPNLPVAIGEGHYDLGLVSTPRHALDRAAQEAFVASTGKDGRGRRLARRFVENTKELPLPNVLTKQTREDLLDDAYVRDVVRHILRQYAPRYDAPSTLQFNVAERPEGLVVDTNIDFAPLKAECPRLSQAYVLASLVEARADIFFGSEVPGEMALNAMRAAIVRSKLEAIDRNHASQRSIANFNDVVLEGLPDVRSAINSGERNFRDLLVLILRAKRFREWVRSKSPDADLAMEYFREVAKDSWLDSRTARVVRWGLVGVAAPAALEALLAGSPVAVATAAGLALSAADAFILDKMLKGWKPNQFVDGDLKRFLSTTEK